MKTRFFPLVSLLALTVLSACASAAPDPATQVVSSPARSEAAPASTVLPPPVPAIATPRGPELEATDPNTVSLASGQLQLVEFFRFT
jgi:hypothetical protein